MPYWPAWALGALCAACAYPAMTTPPDPALEQYRAQGNDPFWSVEIHQGRIDFQPAGGARITVDRPDPRPSFNGRRYETAALTVDLTYSRCNDGMSGRGFEHQVMVIEGGRTWRGCGGAHKPEWDG